MIRQVIRNLPRTGNFPVGKGCLSERTAASIAARKLCLFLGEVVLAALGNTKFLQGEMNEVARVALLGSGTTTLVELKRTSRTSLGRKACKPTRSLAPGCQSRLPIRASRPSGMAVLSLFDLKVSQIETLGVRLVAANAGLNDLHCVSA